MACSASPNNYSGSVIRQVGLNENSLSQRNEIKSNTNLNQNESDRVKHEFYVQTTRKNTSPEVENDYSFMGNYGVFLTFIDVTQ